MSLPDSGLGVHGNTNACAQERADAERRSQRVPELLLAPSAYELRHEMAILASHEEFDASRAAFLVLRDTRDCLLAGADADSTSCRKSEDALSAVPAELRVTMRRDPGAPHSISTQTD